MSEEPVYIEELNFAMAERRAGNTGRKADDVIEDMARIIAVAEHDEREI